MKRTLIKALLKGALVVTISGIIVIDARSEDKVFFGSLHSHTSYSDGAGTPDEAFKSAKQAGMNFFAVTEHNHRAAEQGAGDRADGLLIAKNPELYNGSSPTSLISAANRNTTSDFVAIYGQEFSSIKKGNHVNVFEVGEVIDDSEVSNGDFKGLVNWLSNHADSNNLSPVIQLNHPSNDLRSRSVEYGIDDFGTQAEWIKKIGGFACTIEVLNGPGTVPENGLKPEVFEDDYFTYLNLGFRVAPSGDQDNHFRNWGFSTNARTGIIADSLTKDKILRAIRERHVYATEDKNLRVIFKVNGRLCGDVIQTPPAVGDALNIEYSIVDDDEPDADYEIHVFSDDAIGGPEAKEIETVIQEGNAASGSFKHITTVPFTGKGQYVFFKVVQENEDGPAERAWTAPVWFGAPPSDVSGQDFNAVVGLPPHSDVGPVPEEQQFIASKNSSVFHISAECISAKLIKEENKIVGPTAKIGRQQHVNCPVR